MPCDVDVLKHVPMFALLDDDEITVLAGLVELKTFVPRQRIWKTGDPSGRAYVLVSGRVSVSTIDEDQQEIVVDGPAPGEFFGFASMLEETPHTTDAMCVEQAVCVEVDRADIAALLERKPHAGIDMLTVLSRRVHSAQKMVRARSRRNPNEIIAEEATLSERIADSVASFGGSWSFIISFGFVLIVYSAINVYLGNKAWDPYPFILLNLFLSMIAAIQAPVIMMSQNRQDQKDRTRSEIDFDVNRRAESEIQGLSRRLNLLGEQVADIGELLRMKLAEEGRTIKLTHDHGDFNQ
jgi:CRP/FNR family transcriptional regulator, cyclic AMP receptor protein